MINARSIPRRFTSALTCAAALLLLSHVPVDAAVVPFNEDFESATAGDDAPVGFNESPGSAWSVTTTNPISGSQSYRGENTDDGTILSLVDLAGSLGGAAATANDFVITAQIRPENTNSSSSSISIGLVALATSDMSSGYLARVHGGGGLRFISFTGGASSVQGLDLDQGTLSVGQTYLFTLTGTYADTNADTINDELTLFFNVEGPNMSGVGTTFTVSAPKTGTYFGLRTSESGTRSVTITVDNFSIIPEPASLALMSFGGALMLWRRQ